MLLLRSARMAEVSATWLILLVEVGIAECRMRKLNWLIITGGAIILISTVFLVFGLVRLVSELSNPADLSEIGIFAISSWIWTLSSICCISPIGGIVFALGLSRKRKNSLEKLSEQAE